jgi:ElaB/YqjD/DUF883 family membrane-anchored ribosome-binding protein
MKTENENTAASSEEVLNELRALAAEAEKLLASAAGQQTEKALDALHERLDACTRRFDRLYRGTKEKITEGTRRADTAIREHPYQSLAIAAGVGLVIGLLLSRRSD